MQAKEEYMNLKTDHCIDCVDFLLYFIGVSSEIYCLVSSAQSGFHLFFHFVLNIYIKLKLILLNREFSTIGICAIKFPVSSVLAACHF